MAYACDRGKDEGGWENTRSLHFMPSQSDRVWLNCPAAKFSSEFIKDIASRWDNKGNAKPQAS
jgi:hypothetical protein